MCLEFLIEKSNVPEAKIKRFFDKSCDLMSSQKEIRCFLWSRTAGPRDLSRKGQKKGRPKMDGRVSHKENLVLKFFYVSWDSNQNM